MEEQRIKNNQDTPEENLVEGTVLADTKVYYKTLVMWDGSPRSTPALGIEPLRKDLQEPLFAQAGKNTSLMSPALVGMFFTTRAT